MFELLLAILLGTCLAVFAKTVFEIVKIIEGKNNE
jgi:hypothetical protein